MKYLILSALLWLSCVGIACDNCNVYLSVSPNDYQNSIGIFMRQRSMFGEYSLFGEMTATKHASHGNDKAFWGKKVYETYQTYELRGTYYHREKWKTTIVLPFVNNHQRIDDFKRYSLQGVGDPMIMESLQLVNTKRDTNKRSFSHRLMLGGGIKFPLGKTNLSSANGVPNLDLQPGTGSWDALLFSTYTAKWKFIGANGNVSIKKNGRDQNSYRYGNTFNGTANLFIDLNLKKLTLRVLGGTYFEKAKMDDSIYGTDDEIYVHTDTGGKVTFLSCGLQLYTSNIQLFGEYQTAMKNELNGYTQLLTRNRMNLGIVYNF